MASRTVVRFVDDLDGGVAEETVRFSLDGIDYELDLSGEHASALRAALKPYLAAARPVSTSGRGSAQRVRQVMQRVNDRARRAALVAPPGEPLEESAGAAASAAEPVELAAVPDDQAPVRPPAKRATTESGVAGVTFSAAEPA